MKITIEITDENQLVAFVHCLGYGQCAVSQVEADSGEAELRNEAIENLKQQLYGQLTEKQFENFVDRKRKMKNKRIFAL